MEDPWANAWGGESSPKPPNNWSSTTLSTSLHDREDDLGQSPSWTAAAEPLGVVDVAWSGNDHAPSWSVDPVSSGGWNPSLYDDIPLGGPSPDAPQPDIEAEPPPDESDEETVIQSETNDDLPQASLEVVLDRHAGPDANDDADGFGSFESGADEEEIRSALTWTPSAPILSTQDSDEWGSPSWDGGAELASGTSSGEQEEAVDEWAEARRLKALRDRQIVSTWVRFTSNMLNAFSLRNSSHHSSNKQVNLPKSCGLQTYQMPPVNLPTMRVNIDPWTTFPVICK